jgi:glycosyltransferase involved in cell wall biosynthesis
VNPGTTAPPEKIALIIPTIGRTDDLRKMLQSLAAQTCLPDQVVIIDEAGEATPLAREFTTLNIMAATFPRGSASAKRNRAIQCVPREIELLGFMDDDIVLEPEALATIREFWGSSAPGLGGVSCNLANHPPVFASRWKSTRLASRLALYDARGGVVMRSGFQTLLGCVEQNQEVQWLPSTAVVYHRQVLAEHRFDEWYEGYSYLEDLDFSYSIGRKYKLMVLAAARFRHYPSPIGRTDPYLFGKKEVLNRLHFVRKRAELSTAACARALAVRAVMSVMLGITKLDGSFFRRVGGNIAAVFSILTHGWGAVA